MSPELQFWFYFLIFNSLFFIPRYLLERKTSSFFPYKGFLKGPISERIRFAINRFNYDVFRLSFDLLWLTLLVWSFSEVITPSVITGIFFSCFVLLWTYHLYYHIFESVYQIEPVFYSDWLMLKTGFQLFFRDLKGVNLLIVLGVIAVLCIIGFALSSFVLLLPEVSFSLLSQIAFLIFGLLGLYSLFNYNYKAYGKIVFPSQLQSLIRNITLSLKTKAYLDSFDFKSLSEHRPYQNYQLAQKPNVYFLVIESYGKLLYDHPQLKQTYQTQVKEMQRALEAQNWHSATHLSTSPITAGASWVSYTSALFGFNIPDQGAYITLLHRPEMRKYEHLMRWFRKQGYRNYRLSTIAGFQGMKIPWDDYQDFYALDEWIKYEDMGYTGRLHGFGPCPPDQFALGYAQAKMENQSDPHFLFFITQNSHSPFVAPSLAMSWEDLNDGTQAKDLEDSSSIFVRPKLEDYREAIAYQLQFIQQFILEHANKEDLFILIGDHQPPVIATAEDGMQTPVHIISQNEAFVEGFQEYGFELGLWKNEREQYLEHPALFSWLVRSLWKSFGKKTEQEAPEYLKKGIVFERD